MNGGTRRHDGTDKIVQKIVIHYFDKGDSSKTPKTLEVERSGEGGEIDGIVWNETLLEKMWYWHPQGEVIPRRAPRRAGSGWRVRGTAGPAETRINHCVWLHETTCIWDEFCNPDSS